MIRSLVRDCRKVRFGFVFLAILGVLIAIQVIAIISRIAGYVGGTIPFRIDDPHSAFREFVDIAVPLGLLTLLALAGRLLFFAEARWGQGNSLSDKISGANPPSARRQRAFRMCVWAPAAFYLFLAVPFAVWDGLRYGGEFGSLHMLSLFQSDTWLFAAVFAIGFTLARVFSSGSSSHIRANRDDYRLAGISGMPILWGSARPWVFGALLVTAVDLAYPAFLYAWSVGNALPSLSGSSLLSSSKQFLAVLVDMAMLIVGAVILDVCLRALGWSWLTRLLAVAVFVFSRGYFWMYTIANLDFRCGSQFRGTYRQIGWAVDVFALSAIACLWILWVVWRRAAWALDAPQDS